MFGLHTITSQLASASELFVRTFGRPPTHAVTAPGRVNLIGEHTDYNEGFALPMAIERQTVLLAARRDDAKVRVVSTDMEDAAEFEIGSGMVPGEPKWANYIKGTIAGCLDKGLASGGFDALLDSTVPSGGGLSSSASIEVATATLIEALSGRGLDPKQKALLCQKAEHDFVGVPCGIMDPFIITAGRAGSALLIDCRSYKIRAVALDDPMVTVLVINSNVRHELTGGGYADRRAQCESAARALGVKALRDVAMDRLESSKSQLAETVFRRARHVVSENTRVLMAVKALESRDWSSLGTHLFESHTSLRDDFEVSTPELNLLVDLAAQCGPDGVIGSRMTGGGFGGCTVTLVRRDSATRVAEFICDAYHEQTGTQATAFITRPASGARVLMG